MTDGDPLKAWVHAARERGASDLHLESGTPPVLRVRGELMVLGETASADTILRIAKNLLDASQWEDFVSRRSADLSHTIAGVRCRINLFQTARGVGLAIRLLSSFQNNLRDCNLHPEFRRFGEARTGLVIVSGPTGSGKSTTLAAMIEEINVSQARHILTLESPVEYYFANRKSFIRQREIPSHSPSFEQAILDAMRENPDVLVIGEMRDPEVMRLTLNAAETGHLVLATMHSATCAEALSRLCMSFPAEVQGSVRAQLADCLVGVVCQRLAFLPQPQLRVPLCEVLLGNSAAKSTVRLGQFSQIATVIQTGGEEGMWSFERYQRWMDQKKDWVRPSQAKPLEERSRPSAPAALQQPAEIRRLAAKPSAQVRAGAKTSTEKSAEDGRIEIAPLEEEDLATLARKISDDPPEES